MIATGIAFVVTAEAYMAYHGMAVAIALAARGEQVTVYYNDPEIPRHVERICRAFGAPLLPCLPLARSLRARLAHAVRVFGFAKSRVLRFNEDMLSRHAAIIGLEDKVGLLFGELPAGTRPARMLISHGGGDRIQPSFQGRARLDLILCNGPKTMQRLLDMGVARAGHIAAPGYPKFDTVRRLAAAATPLFAVERPVVFYNPHWDHTLGSWRQFVRPMLAQFRAQRDYNLVVAPHIKMFHFHIGALRRRWEARGNAHIRVDTGSDLASDGSYTEAADIYVGDVSSQVYEFVARPRPCVFLNAHRVDWRNDPHYLHWQMGDVVEEPAALLDAIRHAPARHHLYVERQRELATLSLGDTSSGAAMRAADLVQQYLREGRVAWRR